MKKMIFLFTVVAVLFSCSGDDDAGTNTDLVGEWKLVEVLADPGDGSGTFKAIASNKTVTFHPDGTISSNGNLCDMSTEAINPTSGTYSVESSTFTSADCDNPEFNYPFEHDEYTLILTYPCFEGCQVKYRKK